MKPTSRLALAMFLFAAGPASAQDKDQEYNPPPAPTDIDLLQQPKTALVKASVLPWRVELYDAPNQALVEAVEELKTGDGKGAADEIEEARGYLKSAIMRGRQEEPLDPWDRDAEGRLEASSDELKKLARDLEAGKLPAVDALRPLFGRYLLALARDHVEKGAELWLSQNGQLAGYDFRAAAEDIGHAMAWNDLETDRETAGLLAETERVGRELTEIKRQDKEAMTRLVSRLRETMRAVSERISAPPAPAGASAPSGSDRG